MEWKIETVEEHLETKWHGDSGAVKVTNEAVNMVSRKLWWAFFIIFWHFTDSKIDWKYNGIDDEIIISCCPSVSASLYASACLAVYGVSVFSETCGHRSASLACPGYMWQAISGAVWLNKQPSEARCGLGHLQLHSASHEAKNVQYS